MPHDLMPSVRRPALDWPLMRDNISRADLDAVIALLQQDDPILTQSSNVRAFEQEWSDWLGVKYSVFVNSGSSANLITLAVLKEMHGPGGEVIVPSITWVSDIAAVLHCGFTPVFVDVDPRTLGMDNAEVIAKHSGHDVDQVMRDIDRDRFLTPDEAVEYGLADSVLDGR